MPMFDWFKKRKSPGNDPAARKPEPSADTKEEVGSMPAGKKNDAVTTAEDRSISGRIVMSKGRPKIKVDGNTD